MSDEQKPKQIGTIGNYYGNLLTKQENGKFYWCIEAGYEDDRWEEIPESLYRALISYEDARVKT